MDARIAALPCEADGDLALCIEHGVAYQRDMTVTEPYDESYWNKCAGYEDKGIALAINRGRIEMVAKWAGPVTRVCDVGIGCGEFIKKRGNTFGRDINPHAIQWLTRYGLWAHRLSDFSAFTFWDVIEHVPRPADYFDEVPHGAHLFTSIPVFSDLRKIRESRHYRPGEHLYYWTPVGFVNWMSSYGFVLLERDDFETRAGRDSIMSFAFWKQ